MEDSKQADVETPSQVRPSEKTDDAPKLPYYQLFAKFLWFAFGGPIAQIALMKQELVDEEKWITQDRFNRVYGVYQALPGPEAYELAVYFGMLSGGYFGGLLGGIGFALPGCLLELLCSYLYVTYGFSNSIVRGGFKCIQLTVSAMIFRALYKLCESVFKNHDNQSNEFSWDRFFLFLFNFLTATIGLNFFASLAISGIMNLFLYRKEKYWWAGPIGYFIAAGTIGFFYLYVELKGKPNNSIIGDNSSGAGDGTDYLSLFILGLIAGCVSFGGAYTTIPFVFNIAVTQAGYVTPQQFLDAIGICSMLPTPLVSFVATIGFLGNGIGGAVLMLIGIFLPATLLPIIGHDFLQKIVDNDLAHPFLEGVAAAVIGLLVQISFEFLLNVVVTGLDAAVFAMSLSVLFHFSNKFTQPILIIVAALAGQTLYTK